MTNPYLQRQNEKILDYVKRINAMNAQKTTGIPPASTTGITPSPSGTTPLNSGITPSVNKDYTSQLLDIINKQNQYLNDYVSLLKNQPSPIDTYKKFSEQLNIPQQRQNLFGIQKQISSVEGLLDKLEEDINKRTSGFLVNEAQRRRKLAVEEKPLREQLADLMKGQAIAQAGYSQSRQELADMLKMYEEDRANKLAATKSLLDYGYRNIPYLEKALTYESPEEKAKRELAEKLKEEETLKKAGLDRYYRVPKAPSYKYFTDNRGNVTRYNPETGELTSLGNVSKKRTTPSSEDYQTVQDAIDRLPKENGYLKYMQDYVDLRNAWIEQGYDPKLFDERFGSNLYRGAGHSNLFSQYGLEDLLPKKLPKKSNNLTPEELKALLK